MEDGITSENNIQYRYPTGRAGKITIFAVEFYLLAVFCNHMATAD